MLWRAAFEWTKGYRLRPWRSPYLRWRIETFWGLDADRITARDFFRFAWERRRELLRFLKWSAKMPGVADAVRAPRNESRRSDILSL